jgi:hypothetical protein
MKIFPKIALTLCAALCSASVLAAWGAIVVNDTRDDDADDTYYTTWIDAPSEAEATSRAMSACRADYREVGLSASGCRTVATFRRCAAYAVNRTQFGAGTSSLLSSAERDALGMCGRRDCKLVISLCNSD